MNTLRFLRKLFILTLNKLCQQRWLLAGLVLLCLFLPFCVGAAAEHTLSEGVSFSGIDLVITAPDGDSVPMLLEEYMGNMRDIRQYCRIEAMEYKAALQALEDGSATAVLVLPEGFVQGILWGKNPDVTVLVSEKQPLEALLTLWIGQSASDLLAAVQAGIYAVLDIYESTSNPSLSWEQVQININLNYSSWTLNRQNLFRTREISATESLPISMHYALSLLAYLCLSAAPLFCGLYQGQWPRSMRRLRSIGRRSMSIWFCSVSACTTILLLLLLPALFLLRREASLLPLLGTACGMALFSALFGALCCLLTTTTAGCGLLSFSFSLISLALAGGILPPVMLPDTLRALSPLSPVKWMQSLAALPMGYPAAPSLFIALAVCALLMAAVSLGLYHHRISRQEVDT